MSAEELARELHEAGREAVEKGCIVRRDVPNKGFIEWDDLDDAAREGRMIQARYLLERFAIVSRTGGDGGMGLFRCAARTELKEKVPDVSDETLLYLNHAVTQAYAFGQAGKTIKGEDDTRVSLSDVKSAINAGIDPFYDHEETDFTADEVADSIMREVNKL